jgi:hypothetical protein
MTGWHCRRASLPCPDRPNPKRSPDSHGDSWACDPESDALNVAGLRLEREAPDALAKALATFERPPLSLGPGPRAGSRIPPKQSFACVRFWRRIQPVNATVWRKPAADCGHRRLAMADGPP